MGKYNRYKNDSSVKVFDTIAQGIWFLISWPFKKLLRIKDKGVSFNKVANRQKWQEIESMLNSGDEIHAAQAVIQADKFFESILRKLGASGEKFADRLRNFENHFSHDTYQSIWDAHKVRNQISHDPDHKLTIPDCKIALERFRRGLNSLGAI